MAFDAFFKYAGIKGESQDAKHPGEIQLDSFSFGVSNAGSFAVGGGGGSGKANFNSFNLTKKVDASSPSLFLACCTGQHSPTAVVSIRKAGGTQEDYLIYTFTDTMIDSYQVGGSSGGSDLPMEQVSFGYGKIEVEYKTQDKTGKLGQPVKAGYDLTKNVKV
jgi:type VI secretion system secreted protein Hcp